MLILWSLKVFMNKVITGIIRASSAAGYFEMLVFHHHRRHRRHLPVGPFSAWAVFCNLPLFHEVEMLDQIACELMEDQTDAGSTFVLQQVAHV